MNQPQAVEFQYGEHTVRIASGGLARQADGAVTIEMGGTVVLVTAVASRQPREGVDFLPLTVDYQERFYAGGRIPGGFFKREGRPTERETLCCRLIDRPIRPLFPKSFRHELQVIATVVSLNPEVPADIPAMLGASAALCLSGIPFAGPMAAARVGYVNGACVLNPAASVLAQESTIDLLVAGTATAVLMVESDAKCMPEAAMLDAVTFGHEQMQSAIDAMRRLTDLAGRPRWPDAPDPGTAGIVAALVNWEPALAEACAVIDKAARGERLRAIRQDAVGALTGGEASVWTERQVAAGLHALQARVVRRRIAAGGRRLDGRTPRDVRPLAMSVGLLPRVHGSALFTRGETQVIATTTLGTSRDAQLIDSPEGVSHEPFLLHYNFPPFCVGETGRLGAKRRDIGHGRLARRALAAVMPDLETAFPYSVRIVSEVTESNGSSSMATICGGSLSLMDAGVPIAAPVAGVAMGLIVEGDHHVVLTDILGDEDHIGDMDFKVAGTRAGITALQMDIKGAGITARIMHEALAQAREARLHILDAMDAVLDSPRAELSPHAPRITEIRINPERIRDVIGKGGATIRALTRDTGAIIDVQDDGTVRISSTSAAVTAAAIARIETLTRDVAAGDVFQGTVVRLMEFGAFVTILPGRDGLVHVSQISDERVERVADVLSAGDVVRVRVLEVDRQGRIRLSMKGLEVQTRVADGL